MREFVSKAFNPSKIFIVLKSELIKKKKKGRNKKRDLILRLCLFRLHHLCMITQRTTVGDASFVKFGSLSYPWGWGDS